MKQIKIKLSKEKFLRNLDRGTTPSTLSSRFSAESKTLFRAKRKGDSFLLYRQKKGLFPLFSCTLRGKITEEEKGLSIRYGFTRPALSGLLLFLWAALLLFVGLSLLPVEPDFALFFLVPGLSLFLPLFFFSPKEKAALEEKIHILAEFKK